jgi:hypothetical protein
MFKTTLIFGSVILYFGLYFFMSPCLYYNVSALFCSTFLLWSYVITLCLPHTSLFLFSPPPPIQNFLKAFHTALFSYVCLNSDCFYSWMKAIVSDGLRGSLEGNAIGFIEENPGPSCRPPYFTPSYILTHWPNVHFRPLARTTRSVEYKIWVGCLPVCNLQQGLVSICHTWERIWYGQARGFSSIYPIWMLCEVSSRGCKAGG